MEERIKPESAYLHQFMLRKVSCSTAGGDPISAKKLDCLKKLAGGYQALFYRVALKHRALGLNTMTLMEQDHH